MKKGLSAVLAASLAFSAFGSVAFAADKELTPLEKFEELVKAGIFDPEGAGNGADLEAPTTRAQIAKILVKLLEVNEDANAETFDDVEADDWYAGYVGALQKERLVDGVSDNPPLFAPNDNVTVEQFAKLVAIALDLDIDANAEVDGEVSDWAKGYVAAVVKAGYLAPQEDYTAEASREVLVNSAFAAKEIIDQIKAEQQALKISSFAATGAKKVEVKFSKAVEKADLANFTLKKGTISYNISKVTLSEDKKTATLELPSKITKGDYTVTYTFASGSENKTVEAKASFEDEKVTKVEFTGDKAPIARDRNDVAYAFLKVFNQYGEDVTKQVVDSGELSVTSGYTTTVDNTGRITLQSSTPFIIDTKVAVSAVHKSTGTYGSVVLSIGTKQQVASLTIDKLYDTGNLKDVTELTAGSAAGIVAIVSAKDQYGNSVTNATYVAEDTVVNVTNPTVANVQYSQSSSGQAAYTTVSINGTNYVAIPFSGNFGAGSAQLFVYAKSTGNRAVYDLNVKDSVKIDTITLEAPAVVAGGDKNVEIPFTALDQFGNEVQGVNHLAKFQALTTTGGISFVPDYVNNKVKLVYNAPATVADNTTQPVVITVQTATYKFVTLNLTVQPNRKPQVISGIKDLKNAFAPGATYEIAASNVKVVDQYGKETTADQFTGYTVKVTSGTADKVSVSSGTLPSTLKAEAAGTSEIKLVLNDGTKDLDGSTYTYVARVVNRADIVGYEVADLPKIYADKDSTGQNTAYAKELSVVGLLADGTKVVLPKPNQEAGNTSTYYAVTVIGTEAGYDAVTNTVYGNNGKLDADKEKTLKLVVTGNTSSGGAVITKDFVVSSYKPVAQTVVQKDATGVVVSKGEGYVEVAESNAANTAAIARDAFKVTDQYGKEITTGQFATIFVTNARDKDGKLVGTGTSATGLEAGATYQLHVVTPSGVTQSIKVIVRGN